MQISFRPLLERLSRRITFRRRLPSRFGKCSIYVSPDASLRWWVNGGDVLDPRLCEAAWQLVRPGETVWDIGANVGLFTYAAAARSGAGGRAIAVEADTWLVDLLRRSGRLPADPPRATVDVIPAAIDSQVGLATLNIARRGRAANALQGYGNVPMGGVRESQTVVRLTLDWLLEHCPAPRVMKVDVEGAEVAIFAGAEKLLRTVRPIILCEVAPDNSSAIAAALGATGYEVFDWSAPAASRVPLTEAPWDTIAIYRDDADGRERVLSEATAGAASSTTA